MDYWNNLIKIKDKHPNEHRRKWADIMLGQINTAGGVNILKRTGELNDEQITQYLKEAEGNQINSSDE